jgi:hypothetical protein
MLTPARLINNKYAKHIVLLYYVPRMFTVRTLASPITIKTFELDVRTDIAGGDLGVEVYTLLDGYSANYNNEAAWTLVANTDAVPVPGGSGVLVPVQDFDMISMKADELRSFYVTMRGSYIESTADALVQSGEEQIKNDALRIDVGSGFSTSKFSTIDTTISPKFAGIIHYEESKAGCESAITETKTVVDYKFLVNATGLDPSLLTKISSETEAFFYGQINEESGYLREYELQYQLAQTTLPTSSASAKPLGK